MNYLTKQQVVKMTLAFGCSVSVHDGEEWAVKRSHSFQEIMEAVESVDIAEIRVRDKNGSVCGWAVIINGLAPDEEVADYSGTLMERLHESPLSMQALFGA